MKEFECTVDGIDVYYLGDYVEDLEPEDLVVPGKVAAVGVYYLVSEYPRFRTALTDDLEIDESSAVVQLSDMVDWASRIEIFDAAIFLMAHDGSMSEEEFKEWEKVNMAMSFMKSQGCDFMAEAKGEFDVG